MKLKWPWTPLTNARRERDHALVRVATLEARSRDLEMALDIQRAEMREERKALGRIIDNALMGAGCAAIFEPDRMAARSAEVQQNDARKAQAKPPLSPAEWRKRVEKLDAEVAERDHNARLKADLEREAEARKKRKP